MGLKVVRELKIWRENEAKDGFTSPERRKKRLVSGDFGVNGLDFNEVHLDEMEDLENGDFKTEIKFEEENWVEDGEGMENEARDGDGWECEKGSKIKKEFAGLENFYCKKVADATQWIISMIKVELGKLTEFVLHQKNSE